MREELKNIGFLSLGMKGRGVEVRLWDLFLMSGARRGMNEHCRGVSPVNVASTPRQGRNRACAGA